MTQHLLEVLIPTYRRPLNAISAIDSVLSCGDTRVGVFCHSNGIEPELESAAALRPALRYNFFSENQGAVVNFSKILEDSRAKYVMLLSDEDRIDIKKLEAFLDLLRQEKYGFVFCSVLENSGANYYSLEAFRGVSLSLEDLLIFFTIDPTYMSGYCFRRDLLTKEVIRDAFQNNEANVYPHLLLRNAIAGLAPIGLFTPGLIIKGEEANTGGDSHSHMGSKKIDTSLILKSRRLLNPLIYGETARVRQFYYLAPRLHRDLMKVPVFKRFFTNLYILSAWLKITCNTHLHVEVAAPSNNTRTTIEAYRNANNDSSKGWIVTYNWIMSIQHHTIRLSLVECLWQLSKLIRFLLFLQRFGASRTAHYIKDKYG